MTKQLKYLDDLKDSSIMYDKNPPKFMTAIVIVILISLIGAVIVADSSKKSEVIHSVGVIQSEDKVYIMSPAGGEIDDIYVTEGQYVEVGTDMITIGSSSLMAQLEMYTNVVNYNWSILGGYVEMQKKVENYDIEKNINADYKNQNPFNANSTRFMYLIYEGFLEEMSNIAGDSSHTLQEKRRILVDNTLMECERVIREYEPTYKQALFQKEYIEALLRDSTIKTKTSGIVHFETILNIGMVVSIGAPLFSISSTIDGGMSIVKFQIPVAYRPHLSENLVVNMDVVGYPSATYGKLKGVITNISSDSNIDSNGNIWFTVEVMIEKTILNEKKESIKVTNGMMVAASIVYEESTWLDWILRGLGIR